MLVVKEALMENAMIEQNGRILRWMSIQNLIQR